NKVLIFMTSLQIGAHHRLKPRWREPNAMLQSEGRTTRPSKSGNLSRGLMVCLRVKRWSRASPVVTSGRLSGLHKALWVFHQFLTDIRVVFQIVMKFRVVFHEISVRGLGRIAC